MTEHSSVGSNSLRKDIDAIVESGMQAASEAAQAGQFELALQIYESLLSTDPQNSELHNSLGAVYGAIGDVGNAEKFFKSAIMINSKVAIYHRNLGSILSGQKRYPRAIREYQSALKLDPEDIESSLGLAFTYSAKGNFAAYEKQLRAILNKQPNHFGANCDLGVFLITQHRFEEAVEVLRDASDAPEVFGGVFANLGNAHVLLNQMSEAKSAFEQAVELEPENPEFLLGLATAERNLGNLTSALPHCTQIVSLAPDSAPARNLLGTVQRELGNFDAAMESFEQSLTLDSDFSAARINRGLLRLLTGNWEQGFSDFEARLKDPNYATVRAGVNCQRWDGDDIQGKSVFLYAEQGFGDTIQNIRFAKSVAESGAQVVVQAQSEIVDLLAGIHDSIRVFSPGEKIPETDVFASLLSLPHLIGVKSEDDISMEPYLFARAITGNESKRLGSGKIKVGINWAGAPGHKEDYKRSIDPSLFTSLAKFEGIRFFNLYFGGSRTQPDIFDESSGVHDLVADFSDSAAIIDNLDLVISVDTATVHLAGALGKKCWALIPYVPDWRWSMERTDTRWYGSVRLFRQPKLNDWGSVMDEVTDELSRFVAKSEGLLKADEAGR